MSALLLLLVAVYAVVFARPVEGASVFYFTRESGNGAGEVAEGDQTAEVAEISQEPVGENPENAAPKSKGEGLSKVDAQNVASDIINSFIGR